VLFERIESPGLAHYSYLVGDQREALVIDPRRDCDVYIDKAARAGYHVTKILETHRNEDYVIGSVELAARTDAEIWHADEELPYQYGRPGTDGQEWRVGRLTLRAIHTPGHTPGSMSYLLHDPDGEPWIVFTGDALFAGDVGRVDLLDDIPKEEMARMLYHSLFDKLLPLGDEVIVCPAHGSGSVCGSAIAERIWTTIGLERRLNPKLQHKSEAAFVDNVAETLERPPYFRRMERWNLEGAPILGALPVPKPLSPAAFEEKMASAVVLDTHDEVAFGGAHVPGALSIWQGILASFAGWYLSYDKPLLLVTPDADPMPAVRTLLRIGYDDLAGALSGGMLPWHMSGRESASIELVTAQALRQRMDEGAASWFLDVRSEEEIAAEGALSGGHHVHLTQLPEQLDEIPRDQPIYVFCGSGLRSMVAASFLQREGREQLAVVLGGTRAWQSLG
jgi:hydroxyacylglutathione hydrolase